MLRNNYLRLQRPRLYRRTNQKGSILLISLLMLIAMTALGVAIFDITSTSQKIVNNSINISNAQLSSNAALSQVVAMIKNSPQTINNCSTNSAAPCYRAVQATPPQQQSASWWTTNGVALGATIPNVAQQPKYYIEQFSCDNTSQINTFRITTRSVGVGANPAVNFSEFYLQSNKQKPIVGGVVDNCRFASISGISGNLYSANFSIPTPGYITSINVAFACSGSPALATISSGGNTTSQLVNYNGGSPVIQFAQPFYSDATRPITLTVQTTSGPCIYAKDLSNNLCITVYAMPRLCP